MTLLKQTLKAKNVKQCELAKAVGLNYATVSRITCGWVAPSRETKIKIARFLKMPIKGLFED